MRWFLFITLFLLLLPPQWAMTQSPTNRKVLYVLRDSGTVNISVEELIPDHLLRKKYFTNIEYAKRNDDNTTLFLKPKNSIKPIVRIEVDNGTPTLSYMALDSLYKSPQTVTKFRVGDIYKQDLHLRVKIIDNYNNALLADGVFDLNPVVVHEYYPELHYTDVDGNSQVYTNGSKTWIPISPTSSAKVVVKDEYGKSRKVLSVHFIDSYSVGGPNGCNPIPVNETDTLRTWEVQALCRFQKRNGIYIQATVEGENKLKRYSELLFITKDK
ncbi:MAG: hypothetical protein J6Y37_09180 [Paludibacteraceae bacterium]|nr:hypothetical protein [Paludibacteraceae bacterium]